MPKEQKRSLIRLPAALYPEESFSVMANQSVSGICYALHLLDPNGANGRFMLELLSDLEKRIARAPSRVLGDSVIDFMRQTRIGERGRRLYYQNIPTAVIGLTRTTQLLEGRLSREDEDDILDLCLDLLKMGEIHGVCIGDSALGLVREVFAGAVDFC